MYGFMIALGVLLASLLGEKLIKRQKLDQVVAYKVLFFSMIGALIGARLYHVLNFWTFYGQNPSQIVMIWKGGMGIWGAVLGGLLFCFLASKRIWGRSWRQVLAPYLNIAAVCLPLAQAVGRVGNYFNQELFGLPTSMPWGIYIQPNHRPSQFMSYNYFHPLFAYEALASLALFAFLLVRFKKGDKGLFAIYLAGYSLIRLALDPLRPERWVIGNIGVAQIVSIAVVTVAVLQKIKAKNQSYQHK